MGLLLAQSTDDINHLLGTELVWGLCAGKTNPFGAASTTNFLGMKFGSNAGSDTLFYNANSGNPYFYTYRGLLKKVGETRSLLNASPAEYHRITTNTGAVPRRSAHFMELSKGSPNFSVTLWSMPLTGMAKDFTPAHLLEGLEQRTSLTVNGESLGSGITGTVAFDEGPGALDTVDLHWNKAAFPLEVYALAAYRVA